MRTLAAALAVLAAGCLAPAAAAVAGVHLSETFTGALTATAAHPAEAEHTFLVPPNATHLRANLSWMSDRAALSLVLVDPDGNEDGGFGESPTRQSLGVVGAPRPGEWTLKVVSAQAFGEAYTADVFVTDEEPALTKIDVAYAVDTRVPVREVARYQHGGYAEVNLVMREGDSFAYAWTSSQPVYFNIHYHADGKTERAAEERVSELDGTFTAPLDQVFSLLWRNENPGTADVEATVEGTFFEHSRTR